MSCENNLFRRLPGVSLLTQPPYRLLVLGVKKNRTTSECNVLCSATSPCVYFFSFQEPACCGYICTIPSHRVGMSLPRACPVQAGCLVCDTIVQPPSPFSLMLLLRAPTVGDEPVPREPAELASRGTTTVNAALRYAEPAK